MRKVTPQKSVQRIIRSTSAEQTRAIGRSIGEKLSDGDVLALCGELGSGKTCFAAGVARGLGVDEKYQITSPTFTLINEYPGRCRLFHFDVYRLRHNAELECLGYEEYFGGQGVVIIEWAEKIARRLPPETVFITFQYVDEQTRILVVKGPENVLKKLPIWR
jgi:tRNA threonylcarbamoyladenosine biosynthesis protein TsaE